MGRIPDRVMSNLPWSRSCWWRHGVCFWGSVGSKASRNKTILPASRSDAEFFFPFCLLFSLSLADRHSFQANVYTIFAFIGPFFCLVLFLTGGLIDSLMLRKTPIQACAFLSSRFGDAPLNLRGSTEQNDILETHF